MVNRSSEYKFTKQGLHFAKPTVHRNLSVKDPNAQRIGIWCCCCCTMLTCINLALESFGVVVQLRVTFRIEDYSSKTV